MWMTVAIVAIATTIADGATATESVTIRGKTLSVWTYGTPGGDPVVVASGDGGWVRLGPHVADILARHGFYVVGLDAKAYLAAFGGDGGLRDGEVAADFRLLASTANCGGTRKAILVGVSEGAGLSVLAAADAQARSVIAGVIGLGLPDVNELSWHWRDALIYVTHGVPHEPTFSTAAIADRVAPLPLAALHSTHDEFVSVASIENVLRHAREPKRVWMIEASDHRFSGNVGEFDRRLFEAIAWVKQNQPR